MTKEVERIVTPRTLWKVQQLSGGYWQTLKEFGVEKYAIDYYNRQDTLRVIQEAHIEYSKEELEDGCT